MQLVTFDAGDGVQRAGVHRDGVIVDLSASPEIPATVLGIIEGGPDALTRVKTLSERADAVNYKLEDVRLLAPIPRPPKILALAGNFVAHILEGGEQPRPKEGATPDVFIIPSSAVIGTGAAIEIPKVSDAVDYELELAVVIGTRAKNVDAASAMDHVAGYAVFNDVSARRMNYPNRTETTPRNEWFDWLNGKWCDTFAAWGPYLVTADEIADPHNLAMELRVNDKVRQSGSTRQMIFTIPETIAFISGILTLEPGDVIAMGTPSGVGAATETYLQPGDIVVGTVEGLGTLTNPVVA